MLRRRTFVILVLCLCACIGRVQAQATIVRGVVTDSKTRKALASVSVYFPGTNTGVITGADGKYELQINEAATRIQASFLGYNSVVKNVQPGGEQIINIQLTANERVLKEVLVKPGKKAKYRNKDNPAVELIRQVIDHKTSNRMGRYDYATYEQYEKIQFSLSNTPEKLRKNILIRKYPFIGNSLDTTTLEGKALLPLFLQETLSENYYRRDPEKKKTVILAEQKVSFDESFIDNNSVTAYLKHVYQEVDIYDNNITIVTNQFLSPIADVAPSFYKYYIVDTTVINGERLVQLAFGPRNTTDLLFQGIMYVTLDGHYAVQKVDLRISRHANLNWVRSMHIRQEFEPGADGRYHLLKTKLAADFGITKGADGGIFGERNTSVRNFVADKPVADSIFKGPAVVTLKTSERHTDSFWTASRHDSLTSAEQVVYKNIDSLQHTKSFKRAMNIAMLLLAGYSKAGPYFEIGPVNTFYSFNPVEGFRGRLGGRTTPALNRNMYLEGYAAYGFKDEKWKYYIGGSYSFTGRPMLEFPVKRISANFQRDTKIPGQELQFVQEDNFLLSFKRGVNDKWLYNDIYNIDYLQEFRNHFSFKAGYKNWTQQAAGGLQYVVDGTSSPVNNLTTSEFSLELRWAPHEEFFQGKLYRIPMPNRYPIITLRAIAGVKGFLEGGYNYENISMNIYKRVYLSQLGYTDVVLEGGYVFGKLPYPLLDIHRANQSYSYQLQSYNLMNFLEFVSDHYASVQIDHAFNGFFLNKIPLVKKIKLREFVSAKILYGGLRNENMPQHSPDLLRFPVNENGIAATYPLQKEPYIEGSVGIGNIFKFFRVDLVRRFTYLDNPNVDATGIRARFKFDF